MGPRTGAKSVFTVDVRSEPPTNDPCLAVDAICRGLSPLGYWYKVKQSPAQSKPYNSDEYVLLSTDHHEQPSLRTPRYAVKNLLKVLTPLTESQFPH